MKSNRLTNILLVAVLAVLLSGRLPAAAPTPVQPAAAAPASIAAGIPGRPDNSMAAISGYISVPAAAFHPTDSAATYTNYGRSLKSNSMTGSNQYVAEVYLPHGSTIDSLECLMADQMVLYEGSCELDVLMFNGTYQQMATVSTSGYMGFYTDYWTNTISYADVDTSQNAYFLSLYLPGNGDLDVIWFGFAIIGYHYNAVYLPTVRK